MSNNNLNPNQKNNLNQQNQQNNIKKSDSSGNLNNSSPDGKYKNKRNKWKKNNFYKNNYYNSSDSFANNISNGFSNGYSFDMPNQFPKQNIIITEENNPTQENNISHPGENSQSTQSQNQQPNNNLNPNFNSNFNPNFNPNAFPYPHDPNFGFRPFYPPPQMIANFPYNPNPQPGYHLVPYYGFGGQIVPFKPKNTFQRDSSQTNSCCAEPKTPDNKKDVNKIIKEYIGKIDEKLEELNKKESMWINLDISSLDDLIAVGKDYGVKYSPDYEYQIDLKLISGMIPELESLNNMIGLKSVKNQIVDLILYYGLKLDNKNYDLLHTVIEGEPGTGKTELAEKLAKIYLKMGILKKDIFKKVRRSDLIAGYLGQTAIKTEKVLEECRGGVLFIDEAYSLGNAEGKDGRDSFSKECIDMLNQWLTENKSEFVCVIAGYKEDLTKSFFSYNTGLERRFPIRFSIETYSDEELAKIFVKKIKECEWDIDCKNLVQIIKLNRKYFKFNGGDMEILFAKCKIAHSKNLLKEKDKKKKVLTNSDIESGLKIYLENPEIKKRGETNNFFSTLYL